MAAKRTPGGGDTARRGGGTWHWPGLEKEFPSGRGAGGKVGGDRAGGKHGGAGGDRAGKVGERSAGAGSRALPGGRVPLVRALPEAALPAEFADLPAPARDKVRRILTAALALFSEYGFHGTAVPEIAQAAEVGTGTIYRYFADKAALVNALYRAGKEVFAAEVWAKFPEDQPREAQFRAVWAAMAGFARDHEPVFRFMELHHHAPYLDAASRAASEDATAPGRDFIAACIAEGVVRDADPDMLVELVWGALIGLAKGCAQGRVRLDPATIAAAGATLWAGLAAPGDDTGTDDTATGPGPDRPGRYPTDDA